MFQVDWLSFGFGVVAALVVFSLILPDSWAEWLGTRKNLPVVLLPLGIIALVLGAGNLIVAFGWAVIQALKMTSVSSWVWYITLAGVVIVVFFVTIRWHNYGRNTSATQNPQ